MESDGDKTNIQQLQEAGYAIKSELPDQYREVIENLDQEVIDKIVESSNIVTDIQTQLDQAASRDPDEPHYTAFMMIPPL